jgi:MFS family permease|tara:strand:- start:568 stop:1947 length:1380 start_codon:yes stop_codon:yes gene_type:complete
MVKKKDSKKVKKLKHNARKRSIKEGIFASEEISFGNSYITPFAIAINSSNSLVALISALSGLLGPFSQIFGSKLIEKYSIKKIILKSTFFRALPWLSFILIAVLFYKGILINILPFLFLVLLSIYIIISNISEPAWFSWVGDIVDEKHRGKWFSKRRLIKGFVVLILTIFAAIFLDYFKENNWLMFGFIILFLLTSLSILFYWKSFKKQYVPKIKFEKEDYFSFWDFLINAKKNNFGKFSIFIALLSFSTFISSSLITIYLLRYLEFSYLIYMTIILSQVLFSLIVLELWGKFADRYGNYRVLYITTILIPIVPILWILFKSPIYLIFVPALISGISWAGFNLATNNFIYDNVSQKKRGFAVSYHNMFNGIGIFFGAVLGAFLIKFLKTPFEPIILIFILSSLTSMLVVFFWIPQIKEIRKTKRFKGSKTLKRIIFQEAKPTLLEEAHEVMSIKKYLRD